ncbi:Pseudogene of Hypothetical protein (C terminalpart) [Mycoplasmopsis agalactiae PG2]|uniref:Uncharacterized protein n=1 Tax=Mycoplasmopsis agalactiae (strain NCTC 10123 / CIP 59.7 / PG2) TaxID=347257 RepID=A5IXK2_MYCAP|nr:Pseudogene of Hypothetical protein (C terminalpart) [Mycoplasmopsis agalactiae PG2]
MLFILNVFNRYIIMNLFRSFWSCTKDVCYSYFKLHLLINLCNHIMINIQIFKWFKTQKNQWIVLTTSLALSIFVICLAISALILKWKLPQIAQMSIAQIVPIITTFAFLPQVLKAIDTRDYSGMSVSMVWTFILANIFWTSYWVFFIINAGIAPQLISALIWQILSLLLYSFLLIKMNLQVKIDKKKTNTTNGEIYV